jgi:inhibitor of cysteine peptidase
MKNLVLMSTLFWIFLGLVSAQGSKAQGSDPQSFDDPKEPVEVAVGQEFRIGLDANPTTGYQWQLSAPLDEGIVTLVANDYQMPRTDRVGAGGKQILTFRAAGQGQTTIGLIYLRHWEKGIPPIKNVTFTVIVR